MARWDGAGLALKGKGRLWGLLTAQFFGAFNDNAWKLLVTFVALGGLDAAAGSGTEQAAQLRTTLVFVAFTLPFLLVSLPAGALADRVSKSRIVVALKAWEVALMAAGTLLLFLFPGGWLWGVGVLSLMGVQSALFSPAKYGIVPELVDHRDLSRANALLQLLTFLAIVLGTGAAGGLLQWTGGRAWYAGLPLVAMAGVGFVAALRIPRVAPARSRGGIRASIAGGWNALRADRVLWLTVLGLTWFWGATSFLGQDLLVCAKTLLGLNDTLAGLLLAVFGLGVGLGSILAARLSGRRVETGLIPMGALLYAACTFGLALSIHRVVPTFCLAGLLGIASGLLSVPLQALLQWRSPLEVRGGILAMAGFLTMSGTLAGSLGVGALAGAGMSGRAILMTGGVLTLAGTLWALWLLPDALLRLALILLTHTFYRLRVVGAENIPEEGGALLVSNHVSFVDGLVVLSATDRRVRFLVDADYYNHPLLKPFMKGLGAIPVSAGGGPRVVLRALRDAGRYLEDGELVCIFAEGQLTRTGQLLPFRRGMERIVKGRDVPIVPVHLDRLWGSIFSREGDRFLFKLPKQLPYPVTISFGDPVPAETPPAEVRRRVMELGEQAWKLRQTQRPTLHRSLVTAVRRHPLRVSLAEDPEQGGGQLSRIRVLAAALALARILRDEWRGQQRVGILLPPGLGGVLVNLAATLAGRTSVNLNYTAGKKGMESAVRQAGLETIVTSRRFLEKAGLEFPDGVRLLEAEDLRGRVTAAGRATALILAWLAPVSRLERHCGATRPVAIGDPVTIIFSSGSTGEPKGVVLTHGNVSANVEAASQVLHPTSKDTALGILPLFHSFGYFLLWFALNQEVRLVLHPSPLDVAAIGRLIEAHRITILVTTPTFLQLYLRRCRPGQLGSLRLVITGAEKLPKALAERFEETFGIRPLEGYGTTECAPVISVNAPPFRAAGFFQRGERRGSVGRPLPGVAVRIVDLETGDLVPAGESGMIQVMGPNVMEGYLGRQELTRESFEDGWYVTGDVGYLDEDGFLTITDRLSRFSKIGGEMVPHGKVEEALQSAAGESERVFAVTGVPDEKKGERLAVLHTLPLERIPQILAALEEAGLPNLFRPRRDAFVQVEELPMLGTGKLDLKEVRRLAGERLGAER